MKRAAEKRARESNQHSYSNEPKRLMARKPDDLPTASYSSDDLKLELEQRMKRAAEKRAREKSRKDKSQQPHERRGIARKSRKRRASDPVRGNSPNKKSKVEALQRKIVEYERKIRRLNEIIRSE